MSGEITHGWTSTATPDGSDVTPSNFNNHSVTWAAASDIRPTANAASAGTTTGKIAHPDHVHQSSAASIITAYSLFR